MPSPAPAPPNLSPRALRTRAALIAAGFDLLVERPIDAVAIDELVARAGVAKGSFFNHFTDKAGFAQAIATEVRREIEAMVAAANAGVADPVERIAGGMRVGAQFAVNDPRRAIVLLRGQANATLRANPLNRGLVADIEAACRAGLLRPEAAESGVLYWLGLCQVLMINLVERGGAARDDGQRVREMMVMGLTGLGLPPARAATVAAKVLAASPF